MPQQILEFTIRVANHAFDKEIVVHWTDEADKTYQLPAEHAYSCGNNTEIWRAKTQITPSETRPLPGNVCFEVEGRMAGKTYWDRGTGEGYEIQADTGVRMLDPDGAVMLLDYDPHLRPDQRLVTVTVATNRLPRAHRVYLRWTTDNWKTHKETRCSRHTTYWHRIRSSSARNPNQYGTEIWVGRMRIGDAFRLKYAVGCEIDGRIHWDNNFGSDYTTERVRLRVLALNLHCYQETDQHWKFRRIAQAIHELDIDIACLQEVGENWNGGEGDWSSNAARIINESLPKPYHLYTDWSHLGFDRYREGVAILSKYPILQTASKYVSEDQDPYSIHSRKIAMSQVKVPGYGLLNVFSAHLSWWSDGFAHQFEQLRHWADQLHAEQVETTLLCGDFNVKAGSDGYALFVESKEYEDQFLKIINPEAYERVFRQNDPDWRNVLAHDGRIDYIWLRNGSPLSAVTAREIFTDHEYGRVSDHTGYVIEFEPC